ncbi:MAG: CHAT domain-containing protein [Bryobacteraceae bacterium]
MGYRLILLALAAVLLWLTPPVRASEADDLLARGREQAFNAGARAALADLERSLVLYRRAHNVRGEAIALGYVGYCYKELGEFPKALEYLLQALRIKERLGDRPEQGKTLVNLGLVYWKTGNYTDAMRVSEQALAIGRSTANRQIEGAALGTLGLVEHELGNYQKSLENYQHALEVHRAAGFVRGETDALGNIGGLYLDRGRYREAIPFYEQALSLDRRENLKPDMSLDLGNLALCQAGVGDFRQSLATYDRALALSRETGNPSDEADWHRGKGSVFLRTGKYDQALGEYRLAAQVYERAALQRELSELLQDMGELHVTLGDLGSADAEYRRALNIAQKIGNPRNVTSSLIDLGDLEWRRQRFSQAAALYRDSISRAREAGNREQMAAGMVQLAMTEREQGHGDQARKNASDAIQIARANGLRPLQAQGLHALAEAERAGGDLLNALAHISTGETIARSLQDPDLDWRFGYARGQCLESLNRSQEAVRAYRDAVTLIESVRGTLLEERFRAGYLEDKYKVYVALVRLLLRLGRINEAFGFAERMRAHSLSTLLVRGTPMAHSQQEQELRERIRRLQSQLEGENDKPQSVRNGLVTWQLSTELAAAERSYQQLYDDREAAHTGYMQVRSPDIDALQRHLTADSALVEYVVTPDRLIIFVLTARALHGASAPVRASDLAAKIELLRDLLARDGDWRRPAESLRLALLDPVEGAGWLDRVKRLYIVPNGTLHYLPFGMLPRTNTNRYLIEDYAISYLPAATTLLRSGTRSARDVFFAEAPARSRLPYAQEEARSIGALFPGRNHVLVGANATESSFKRQAGQYRIIHLATHGSFNKLNPLFSAMELEPDQSEDGHLQVHEIMNLPLQANLVVLSACDTALASGYFSDIPAGDDFLGLTQAFLHAGSHAVLATLWKVNDRSTLDFMRTFYRVLANTGKADALAEVQRTMLRGGGRTASPYFWAPFVLVGQ